MKFKNQGVLISFVAPPTKKKKKNKGLIVPMLIGIKKRIEYICKINVLHFHDNIIILISFSDYPSHYPPLSCKRENFLIDIRMLSNLRVATVGIYAFIH